MTTYYRVGLAQMASPFVDFDGDTIRVAFLTSTYTLDKETHEFWSDVSANEISAGGGYTAGGIALSSKTATRVSNVITFDAADITLTQDGAGATNARQVVLYKDTGTPATSQLIKIDDMGSDKGWVSGDLTIAWNASGIIVLTLPVGA